jgi:hypothetical protein
MNGKHSSSPKEASATGRPDRDPLATQDDPAKFLTQDSPASMVASRWGRYGSDTPCRAEGVIGSLCRVLTL